MASWVEELHDGLAQLPVEGQIDEWIHDAVQSQQPKKPRNRFHWKKY